MKTLTFAALLLSPVAATADPLPAGSSVATQPGNGTTSFARLDLTDTGNRVWTLQASSNLSTWSDTGTLKVRNSLLRIQLPKTNGTQLFYRLRYNSDAQTAANDVADALLLPATAANYANPTLPAHLLTPQIRGQDNTPFDNAVTNAGATLGRVLFYDKRLSANNTVSCSSCHQAAHGYSDPERFSTGFAGGKTSRNSMGLTSNRYYLRGHYFWDERAATLEDQVLMPIQNSTEMGLTLTELVSKVSAEPYYATLFTSAFGSSTVTSDRISKALAQFVRSIASGASKYDLGVPQNFANFTAQENQGRAIFTGQGGCAACHGSDNFVPGNAIFNNGLENPYVDKGLGGITGLTADEGFFKVGSLRNIELTAPYMHDGRFATLEEVVEFYNSGVVNHPNLSPQLRVPPGNPGAGNPRRLNLNAGQKAALVAFLKTLTDTAVTSDAKFSDPFRYDAN
ncbi:cytochrome c peroxidase [Luteolibacter sp. LG18]|uniref:cytochrome-c peroxidase n=1 Tax=Luteolibacter sp. LG18 TaxID=2819286 RepID=UPI002B2FADA2|nr:cytochrome-c peroxidase [Luteolibacter sp. LG18]